MIIDIPVRLAGNDDAACIAAMSRDFIETGLGWSWTAGRVLRSIHDTRTNTVVTGPSDALHGFAIMRYLDDHAHLLLLAVAPSQRRRGIGTVLVGWLEAAAQAAGAARIQVEARRSNYVGREFYNQLGYHEREIRPNAYAPGVDGVRLEKWLREAGTPLPWGTSAKPRSP